MYRVFSVILALAFCFSVPGVMTAASDWEEDGGGDARTRIPRPAPPIQRRSPSSPGTGGQVYEEDEQPSQKASVYVSPSPGGTHGGSKPRLEANVSKWGAADSPEKGYLTGSARESFSEAPERRGLLTGAADAFLQGGIPFIAPKGRTVPPSVFRGWIEKTHPQFALSANAMARDKLIEVKGAWDDSSRTLRSLGIPHTRIPARRLRDQPLEGTKVMVVNCAGDVPRESLQRIRDFVAQGGYLLTTDWALDGLVQRAFPGHIEWNRGKTDGNVVDAVVVDSDPIFTVGTVRRAGWKLDDGSQTVRVLNPSKVKVLVRSQQLARSGDDPDRQGIVAATFRFGRGQVLHLVGHFDNNSGLAFVNALPDPAPGIGISLRQAIASNFLVAGLSNR